MKRNYDHVFFDLDRTLWDFETNSRTALAVVHREMKLPNLGIDNFSDFVEKYQEINERLWGYYRIGSMSKSDLRKKRFTLTLKEFGVLDPVLGERMDSAYLDVSPYQTALLPSTMEALDYLANHYKLHIITNGFEEVQHIKMERSGLTPYFDVILTSESAKARKPDPSVFKLALKMAEAQPHNSLMIGDDLHTDILGARNMNIDQVYLNPESVPHDDEVTHEISDLKELISLL